MREEKRRISKEKWVGSCPCPLCDGAEAVFKHVRDNYCVRYMALPPPRPMPERRYCYRCGRTLPASEFYKDPSRIDGLDNACKDCTRACVTAWNRKNLERRKNTRKVWRKNNPEKYKARRRAAKKAYNEKYPKSRREHKRREKARKREAFVELFSDREIFDYDSWVCQWCGRRVDPELKFDPYNENTYMCASLDHIFPLSKGGKHSRDNVQLMHLKCNSKKGDRIYSLHGICHTSRLLLPL